MARLAGRCAILLLGIYLYFTDSAVFDVLLPGRFFEKFSLLHLLWGVWMADMIWQLVPAKRDLALGSKKLFKQYFVPANLKKSAEQLKQYVLSTSRMAGKILLLWTALILLLSMLRYAGWLGDIELFMISVLFYVCDLICVLIWCPFRLLLKNRCCTTCRIFNWDHLMMFTPMLCVGSFYSVSLLVMAVCVWVVWEAAVLLHPERFWWGSNVALSCENCTDKLCTQYCRKLQKKNSHAKEKETK